MDWKANKTASAAKKAARMWRDNSRVKSVKQAVYLTTKDHVADYDDVLELLLRDGASVRRHEKWFQGAMEVLREAGRRCPSGLTAGPDTPIKVPARITWQANDLARQQPDAVPSPN